MMAITFIPAVLFGLFVAKIGVAIDTSQTDSVNNQAISDSNVANIGNQGGSGEKTNTTISPTTKTATETEVNQLGSGEKTNTTISPTTKTTTETKDPVVNINNLIEQIPNLCNPSLANKSCNSIVTQIRNATNKAGKCSFTESLQTCVDANCPKIPDVDKNVNAMKKICNGANLISVSTMLICSLAVVFWFTQG